MHFEEMRSNIENARSGTLGYASGVFDVFHAEHRKYLESCASHCGTLVVGVDSNQRVQELKGPDRPHDDEYVRVENVKRAGFMSFVKHSTSRLYIAKLVPDVIFIPESQSEKQAKFNDWGCDAIIVIIPDTLGISSTEIIRRIRLEKDDLEK